MGGVLVYIHANGFVVVALFQLYRSTSKRVKSSEIILKNVFCDDYHSWNYTLTLSNESVSDCLVYVYVCMCVCVRACFVYLR